MVRLQSAQQNGKGWGEQKTKKNTKTNAVAGANTSERVGGDSRRDGGPCDGGGRLNTGNPFGRGGEFSGACGTAVAAAKDI